MSSGSDALNADLDPPAAGSVIAQSPAARSQVLYWRMTSSIREDIPGSMDNLAQVADRGEDLVGALRGTVGRLDLHRRQLHALATFARLIGHPIRGTMADMGSGTGVGAAILSMLPGTERVYAIEYSVAHVLRVMPRVFDQFRADTSKIVRVVGDFNRTELVSGSLDLVFGLASYHHAENLDAALAEAARLLRPGGLLVLIERAHPDQVTDSQLQVLLDKPFDEDKKRRYGIPIHQNMTRREWGEHEYRIKEWTVACDRAGFDTACLTPRRFATRLLDGSAERLRFGPLSIRVAALLYRNGLRRLSVHQRSKNKHVFLVGVRRAG